MSWTRSAASSGASSSVLPRDIVQSIRPLVEMRHDVRRWTEFPRGGHFAALEVPDLLAEDVTAFFRGL